jgi:hypothetical protein
MTIWPIRPPVCPGRNLRNFASASCRPSHLSIASQLLKNAEFALQALSTSFPDVLQFGADEIRPADIAQGYERAAHTRRVVR